MKRPENRVVRNGLLKKSWAALIGLRPPAAEHTGAEGALLREYSTNSKAVVELGVAEGASAWEIRKGMAADGVMFLVDPYPLTRLGRLCPARLVAHRLVNSVTRGSVHWIEEPSQVLTVGWSTPIDFLFIDADHSYPAVKADWEGWAPHVVSGGHVAMHDARTEAAWVDGSAGPAQLLRELEEDPKWEIVGGVDSLAVLQRA
jgi:predicted O-methyltransferase YrrM